MESYLDSTRKLFRFYKSLGDKSIAQVSEKHINYTHNDDSNSIAILVKHISGNMLSRWTNFLQEDGEKEWRNRDDEFTDDIHTKEELLVIWEKGWDCLFGAIDPLTDTDLERILYIRNEGHSVVEALNRQLGHYAYHVGQLVFLAKMLKEGEWDSLSIPKGQSASFNKEKFEQEKQRKNFI